MFITLADIVQVRNPKTNRYIKIDRDRGMVIGYKETPGPWKDVPIARRRKPRVEVPLDPPRGVRFRVRGLSPAYLFNKREQL